MCNDAFNPASKDLINFFSVMLPSIMCAIGAHMVIINPDEHNGIDDTEEGNKEYKKNDIEINSGDIGERHDVFCWVLYRDGIRQILVRCYQ